MEIIDAFCGIGPWQKRDRLLPWKPDDILGLMDHFGIARALTHANFTSGGGNALHGNAILAEAAAREPRFMPAFAITPYPHADEPSIPDFLAAMRAAGSRAVWFMPQAHLPVREMYGELLETCVARRLPVLLNRDTTTPADVATFLRDWPGLRLVLVGCSYMEDQWLFPLLKRHGELRLCVGQYYIPADSPHRFLREFPAERLVFGSGLPFFSPGGLLANLFYADITDAEREAILGGNIRTLLEEAKP
jgi:predicted TIM-barrel fold metal-dependent hydrolase